MNIFETTFNKYRDLLIESISQSISEAVPLMLSPEKIKELEQDYANHMPYRLIAKKYGISVPSVRNYLIRTKVLGTRSKTFEIPKEIEQEIVKKFKENIPITQISADYGIGIDKIVPILVKHKINNPLNAPTSRILTPEQQEELNQLYNSRVKVVDLARIFDISLKTVYRYIHRGKSPINPRITKLTGSQEKQIYQDYLKSSNKIKFVDQVAKQYNVTGRTIFRALAKQKKLATELPPENKPNIKSPSDDIEQTLTTKTSEIPSYSDFFEHLIK